MSEALNIETVQTGDELERCPFPIPYGWYMIDYSDQIPVGEIKIVQAFDKEWVVFRGDDNSVGVTDPYCPHLGAHLGHGGKIVGNNIQCPFHNWEFNSQGWCKKIPYGKVMPGIAKKKPVLQALPVQEKYGMVFVWYHPHGDEPSYKLPVIPEFENPDEHVEPRRGCWDISTCLQEMGENSVDTPHLKFLHGTPIIPPVDAKIDGDQFKFDIGQGYIVGTMYGLGIQTIHHSKDGVSMLMFSTALPVTKELSRTRMTFTFKNYAEGTTERQVAEHLYQHSIGAAEGEESAGFESVDLIVWDNKKYRPNPLLCDGDGPILTYRKYAQDFYVDLDTNSPTLTRY